MNPFLRIGRAAAGRLARTLPRAAITMATATSMGFAAQIKDLSGTLPESQSSMYGERPAEWVNACVWHHSATKGQTIRTIAQWHVEVNGWPGIGYHYAIGWDGSVYQLHPITTWSYHAQGYNRTTIGVVLVGNFQERGLTPEMESSILKMREHLAEEYGITQHVLHRDLKATLCPGDSAALFLNSL